MFGRKKLNPGTIDCLIGAGTAIQGDVRFRGGLRIDGEVRGNVIAEDGAPSMLVLSENARVEGQVRAAHLVINGTIIGPVQADELLELQPGLGWASAVSWPLRSAHTATPRSPSTPSSPPPAAGRWRSRSSAQPRAANCQFPNSCSRRSAGATGRSSRIAAMAACSTA